MALVLIPMHFDSEDSVLRGIDFGKTSEVRQVRVVRKIRNVSPCRFAKQFAKRTDRLASWGDRWHSIFIAEADKVLSVDVEVFHWGASGQRATQY